MLQIVPLSVYFILAFNEINYFFKGIPFSFLIKWCQMLFLIPAIGHFPKELQKQFRRWWTIWSGLTRWFSGKESACLWRRHRRHGFNPWMGKIPWRRKWQPTPVCLPGEFPWTEEPGGLRPMGSQRVRHDWATEHMYRSVRRRQHVHQMRN